MNIFKCDYNSDNFLSAGYSIGFITISLVLSHDFVKTYNDRYVIKLKDDHFKCFNRLDKDKKDQMPSNTFRILTGDGFALSDISSNRFSLLSNQMKSIPDKPNHYSFTVVLSVNRFRTKETIETYLNDVKKTLIVMSDKLQNIKDKYETQ